VSSGTCEQFVEDAVKITNNVRWRSFYVQTENFLNCWKNFEDRYTFAKIIIKGQHTFSRHSVLSLVSLTFWTPEVLFTAV